MRSTRTKSASLALRRWRNRRYFDRLVQRYVCGRSIPSWGLCRPHLICAQTPRVVGQGWSTTQQRYSSRLRAGATYLPVRTTMLSEHTIARAAFLQAHGSMGCALRWCATRSRRQIACSKATLQIPRSHVPLPISFLANPESFRLPPCRSRRRQNSRKRHAQAAQRPQVRF